MLDFNALREREAIIRYLRDWFNDKGENSKAIIGISGGKDSTICAALLARAIGPERILGIIMPDKIMPDIQDAIDVCEILDIEYKVMCIYEATQAYNKLARENFTLTERTNAAISTNMPARARMTTLYLAAQAQSVPAFVINTCNRSEDYVGYSTKYGDSAGDVSVLQDLLVSEVLAIGDTLEELPAHLVHKTPSDGMCGKSDEDNLGYTYNQLDTYIRFVEDRAVVDVNFDDALAQKIRARHLANLHKLKQIPSYKRPNGEML